MTWQDIVAIIIVVAATIFFVMRMARSFRHGSSCPSCRHHKDDDATNGSNSNCHASDACAGCPLHDSCHKS